MLLNYCVSEIILSWKKKKLFILCPNQVCYIAVGL